MSAIVNELYCFYGKKEESEKFYRSFTYWLKEDHGVSYDKDTQNKILTQFGIKNDSTGNTTLKVELQAAYTSFCSDIEELIQKSNADVSFKMCSQTYEEDGNLWCFNDDVEGTYLPESYIVNVSSCGEDSRFSKLKEKHFYTESELKSVLDECFNESKSVEEYIDFLKEFNKSNDEKIYIAKLQKGNRKDLLLCSFDKDLLESLKDPSDEKCNWKGFHSELYEVAWLNKYGKDKNYRTYSEVGDKWENEKFIKVKAFRWYIEGSKNKEIFSLVKMAQGYYHEYNIAFFDYVNGNDCDYDNNDDMAVKYFTEAYETCCKNPDSPGYRGKECGGIAAYWLAMWYMPKNKFEEANEYFKKAIEFGNNEAKTTYAGYLFTGNGVEKDVAAAMNLAKEAVKENSNNKKAIKLLSDCKNLIKQEKGTIIKPKKQVKKTDVQKRLDEKRFEEKCIDLGSKKDGIFKKMKSNGTILMVEFHSPEEAVKLAKAMVAGGITVMCCSSLDEDLEGIKRITEEVPEMLVGTINYVTEKKRIKKLGEVGIKFILSTETKHAEGFIKECILNGIILIPGYYGFGSYKFNDSDRLFLFPPCNSLFSVDNVYYCKVIVYACENPDPNLYKKGKFESLERLLAQYVKDEKVTAIFERPDELTNLIKNNKWDEVTEYCKKHFAALHPVQQEN